MPKRTKAHRGAAASSRRKIGAEGRARGPLARLRGVAARAAGAMLSRLPRSGRRREIAILTGLGLALIVGVASIGTAAYLYKSDHDWAQVASVNGHSISREALRARVPVVEFLAMGRVSFVNKRAAAGDLTDNEMAALRNLAGADLANPVEAARNQLIDEELLREEAAKESVTTPAGVDVWAEAERFASSDIAVRIELVRLGLPSASPGSNGSGGSNSSNGSGESGTGGTAANGWPAASASNVQAAIDRVRQELTSGNPVEPIVSSLHDAGWSVFGRNLPLSASGAPDDPSLEVDPTIAAGALRGAATASAVGTVLGPSTDANGRVSLARILPGPPAAYVQNLADPKMDFDSFQSWAEGQALRRALRTTLRARWASSPATLAHFRELVVGLAPTSGAAGPWVELSALPVDRLAHLDPASIAGARPGLSLAPDSLAATLRGMAVPEREALWRSLVQAASAAGSAAGSGGRAGELGYLRKGDLTADVGKAAFDSNVKSGDVLGPIATTGGSQLFLIEARYSGTLDDRALTALSKVRSEPAPDLVAYTALYSPADVPLASDAGWRADREFATGESARSALFDTPLGVLSDPFVLDGKLALAVVSERKTAAPDAATADRIYLDAFEAWLASCRSAATITRSNNPLPEVLPSSTPTSTSGLVLPSAPLPPLVTPALPSI